MNNGPASTSTSNPIAITYDPATGKQNVMDSSLQNAATVAYDSSGNTIGLVGAGGKQIPTRRALDPWRTEAMHKLVGCATGGVVFNKSTGGVTALYTSGYKMETEGDFDAVRLAWVNRRANAATVISALVGVTETADTSTSAKLSTPIIGGISYPALAGATDVNGFRSVTWGGATSGSLSAANLAQQVTLSDWTPLSSVPRADGGTRPLFITRTAHDCSANGTLEIHGNYPALINTPTTPMRNRIVQAFSAFSDGVATPGTTMTLGTQGYEVYPIFRYRVPVFSVWSVGDSISQQDGGGVSGPVVDSVSTWVHRACLDLSTPQKPIVFSNLAASSNTATTYFGLLQTFLAAGCPPPSCLVIGPASVNDGGSAPNIRIAEQQASRAMEIIKLAAQYGIPYVVFMPWIMKEDYANVSYDNLRRSVNVKIAAIAQAYGVQVIDMSGLSGGFSDGTVNNGSGAIAAGVEYYNPAYRFNSMHPNEVAVDAVMTPALKKLLQPMVA